MNDGKKIERFVRLIQETYKDIPNTEIHSNYKIKNKSDRYREFDVFVKSIVNGFEINIAIECKDFKTPVSVEKIEAFNSKCSRIKNISKKVFVSSNGYQKDAFNAGRYFDIELYTLQEIDKEVISKWFPFKQLNFKIKYKVPLNIGIDNKEKDILKELEKESNLYLHFYDNIPSINIGRYFFNVLNTELKKGQLKTLHNITMLDFMKRKPDEPVNKKFNYPFVISIQGAFLKVRDKKIPVKEISTEMICWFEDSDLQVSEARQYSIDNNVKANVLNYKLNDNKEFDIVINKENNFSIFMRENNKTVKLKTLASYDPKTDKLEIKK